MGIVESKMKAIITGFYRVYVGFRVWSLGFRLFVMNRGNKGHSGDCS